MISMVVKGIHAHGIRPTLAFVLEDVIDRYHDWIDAGLDRRYGTDTTGIIADMGALGLHAGSRKHASRYQGIQIPIFRRIVADLRALGMEPRHFTFADFGSGKGRAAMLAAENGFSAVYGFEISPVLHAVAERNVALFRARNATASPITLYCQDATDCDIPRGDLMCFFYNPFDAEVMGKVLENLAAAYHRAPPRRMVIAYRNPQCAGWFQAHPYLRLVCDNADYKIYVASSV